MFPIIGSNKKVHSICPCQTARTDLRSWLTVILMDSVTLNHHHCFFVVFHTQAYVGPREETE